jgi:hypothetical protein
MNIIARKRKPNADIDDTSIKRATIDETAVIDDNVVTNHLLTLSVLDDLPRALLEMIAEYCHDIPPVCYIFGGIIVDENNVETNGRIINDKWFDLQSTPIQRESSGACRIGDTVYVTAGCDIHGNTLKTVDRLHLPTLKWSTGQELPESRQRHGCVAVDDDMYIIGGMDYRGRACRSMFRYESKTGTMVHAPPMKSSRHLASYVVLNKRIYALGGYDTESCEMYDTSTNQWTYIASMMPQQSLTCAVIVDGNILLLGGEFSYTVTMTDTINEYSPSLNNWRTLNWKLPFCHTISAAWYDSARKALYVVLTERRSQNTMYVRQPINTGNWVIVSHFPARINFGWTIV